MPSNAPLMQYCHESHVRTQRSTGTERSDPTVYSLPAIARVTGETREAIAQAQFRQRPVPALLRVNGRVIDE